MGGICELGIEIGMAGKGHIGMGMGMAGKRDIRIGMGMAGKREVGMGMVCKRDIGVGMGMAGRIMFRCLSAATVVEWRKVSSKELGISNSLIDEPTRFVLNSLRNKGTLSFFLLLLLLLLGYGVL